MLPRRSSLHNKYTSQGTLHQQNHSPPSVITVNPYSNQVTFSVKKPPKRVL